MAENKTHTYPKYYGPILPLPGLQDNTDDVYSIVDVCQDNAREEFISILTSLSVTNHVEERVSSGGCNCNRCTAVR